jgi:murein DD-endopeptidase MepM/ murein hydrolase activator NlpD
MPAPRRTKPGKHAAPTIRPQLLPGLLLVSAGAAFAGLAALPNSTVGAATGTSASTDVLALGGPDPFADLVVSFKPPLPKPVVQAKIVTKKATRTATKPVAATTTRETATTASVKTGVAMTEERASRSTGRTTLSSGAWVRPCSGTLTSGYGRRWGRLHAGLDFGAPTGTPIRAVANAVVHEIKRTSSSGGYGNLTILELADGTLLYHAHQSKIMVTEGQVVSAGETIGLVGSTGHSTGPHLHFEVHPDGGGPIDPRPWLNARGIF